MALTTVEQRKDKILKLLRDDKVRRIVLVGESGVGKTWTAREVIDRAISDDLFDMTLWVFLNRKYDSLALYKNIARQLSLFSTTEEWENDDDSEEVELEEEGSLEKLRQNITAMLVGKRCLLILDDEGNKMNEEEIMSNLNAVLPNQQNPCKVLITRIESDSRHIIEESVTVEVKLLSEEESAYLLQERSGISDSDFPNIQSLVKHITCLPAVIVMIAEALSYLREHDSGVRALESALEEAASNKDIIQLVHNVNGLSPRSAMTECCWHSWQFFCKHGSVHCNELITYWIMEGCLGHVDCIENAYVRGHRVMMELVKRGLLKKQEDSSVFVERAMLVSDDHRFCGFGGTARLGLGNVFKDGEWEGLGRITPMDGMIRTFCSGEKWEKLSTLLLGGYRLCKEIPETFFQRMQGLQVLALFNPRIKSLPLSLSKMQYLLILVLRGCDLLENGIEHIRELKKLTVLEISGATSLKIIPDDFFEQTSNLRCLNLSAVQMTLLPSSFSNLSELRRLILRGCSRLEKLPSLKAFKSLEVLDLSGATCLKKLKDPTFSSVQKLQMLDLSQTQIKRLPKFGNHIELTQLVLTGCSCLPLLPSLKTLSSLQILDLSNAGKLKQIISFPSNNSNLYDLYLRGTKLLKLPCTTELKHLKSIDLSGASSLVEIEDKSFEHLMYLELLNLSKTKLKNLPSLSNLGNLRQLLLKDCSSLETLPKMEGLTRLEVLDLSGDSLLTELPHLIGLEKLEVLDLSGCSALMVRKDQSFEYMTRLYRLNFSGTKIECLPSLSNIRKLFLSGCLFLIELPRMNGLENLKVFDVSGCSAMTVIHDKFFEHTTRLLRLNLSETKIGCLPSLSNPCYLRHLLLRDCVNLAKLPPAEALSKLEELNLCGASSLTEIEAGFFEHMTELRILDLSRTTLVHLPSISNLVKLSQLSLQGCSLKEVQGLEALTSLEVLDLSGSAVGSLPSLISFSSLRELLLRDCLSLEGLSPLESLKHLEILDLFGTKIKEFPYGISELTCLKELYLPDMKDIQVDWGKIKCLPEKLNWLQSGISKFAEESSKPSITVSGTDFFKFLEKNPKLWETCFKKFHFSVCYEGRGKYEDFCFQRNEFIFRDIYSQTINFPYPKECSRSLVIRGFDQFPNGIKDVLRRAEFVSLIENKFISCVSDLGANDVKDMKGCWIERCSGVGSIEKHVGLGEKLEILWVSNMPNLKSVYSGDVQSESFKNLKSLYLDCCPVLVNVFSSSQVPENLEILHIKFCDRVETVFASHTSAECKLQKLQELHVLELPELKSIGGVLPSLQIYKERECPKLRHRPSHTLCE